MKQSKIQEWKGKLNKDGLYLKRIRKNQTPELCKIAIKQNPMALEFANEPTLELCQLAVGISKEALKFVPYNEETKEWFVEEMLKNLPMLPKLNYQPEYLQMVYLKTYSSKWNDVQERNARVALEKAKCGANYTTKMFRGDFEVMYEKLDHAYQSTLNGELIKSGLSIDDKDELLLMLGIHHLISRLNRHQLMMILEEKEKLPDLFGWNPIKQVRVRLSDDKEMYPNLLAEEYSFGLSFVAYKDKTYRLCRYAARLHQESKWFSPYHALELLMEHPKY